MAFTPLTKNSTTSNSKYDILKARTIATNLSDVKPQVKEELIRIFGWDLCLNDWMEEKGQMTAVKNMEVYHKEKQAIRATFTLASQSGSGSGPITLNIATANQTTTSETQSPFIATGSTTTVPVRQQDVILCDDGTQAIITAVSGTAATAYTVDGSTFPTVGAGTIRVISNAVPESSDSVNSRFTQGQGYTSVLQRLRNTETITGDSLAIVDWFKNYGEGQNSDQYYSELITDCYNNHKNDRDIALLTSKQTSNTTLANVTGQETTMTTNGYIPWLETNANVETYTSGNLSLDEFDALIAKFHKYRGGKEYEVWSDYSFRKQVDDFMRAETGFTAGGVVYSTASKDRYVDFGFSSATRSGVSLHFNTLPVLDQEQYLGGTTYYEGMGLFMPVGSSTITAEGNDVKVPLCEILYQDAMGYEKGYREWVHGGRSAGETNGIDNMVYEVQSVIGFRGIGGNRHGLIKTA